MGEQEVGITTSGKYNNLNLKSNVKKGIAGLDDGNWCVIKKVEYPEGKPFVKEFPRPDGSMQKRTSYICTAEYKGVRVSFFLNEREHEEFKNAGGIDDKVKVVLVEEKVTNRMTGMKTLVPRLHFEKVE
jgi:hypothetical protein